MDVLFGSVDNLALAVLIASGIGILVIASVLVVKALRQRHRLFQMVGKTLEYIWWGVVKPMNTPIDNFNRDLKELDEYDPKEGDR